MTSDLSKESYRLEGIAFGLADGLIMCLGLIIGIAEATSDTRLVIVAGIIGGFANAFGNSIGFFMSQSAERALQIQTSDHGVETRIHSEREVLINSIFSFVSTIAAVLILLSPFMVFSMILASTSTFIIGIIMAFILGSYIGKISYKSPYKEGVKYAILAILGAIVSHLIADCIQLVV